MLMEQTLDKMNVMKLTGMAEAFRQQLGSAPHTKLSFDERLGRSAATAAGVAGAGDQGAHRAVMVVAGAGQAVSRGKRGAGRRPKSPDGRSGWATTRGGTFADALGLHHSINPRPARRSRMRRAP